MIGATSTLGLRASPVLGSVQPRARLAQRSAPISRARMVTVNIAAPADLASTQEQPRFEVSHLEKMSPCQQF